MKRKTLAAGAVFLFLFILCSSYLAQVRPPGAGGPYGGPPGRGPSGNRPGMQNQNRDRKSGPEVYQVPDSEKLGEYRFIDAHSHITRTDQDLRQVVKFMDDNNVERMVVLGMKLEGGKAGVDGVTRDAVKKYPDRLSALVYEFSPTDESSLEYVREKMESGQAIGVGELFANGHGLEFKGDGEVMQKIYALAGEKGGVVNAHWTIGSDSKNEPGTEAKLTELKNALAANPKTFFILAHCGAGPPPQMKNFRAMMESLLSSYPNLYMDIAGMHINFYDGKGNITGTGKIILDAMKKYPDRFMVGFDLLSRDYPDPAGMANKVRLYRRFLDNLPADIAKKVASENARRVFGFK